MAPVRLPNMFLVCVVVKAPEVLADQEFNSLEAWENKTQVLKCKDKHKGPYFTPRAITLAQLPFLPCLQDSK